MRKQNAISSILSIIIIIIIITDLMFTPPYSDTADTDCVVWMPPLPIVPWIQHVQFKDPYDTNYGLNGRLVVEFII